MSETAQPSNKVYCSFCGENSENDGMIAGPTVYICFDCIDYCSEFKSRHENVTAQDVIDHINSLK